MFTISDVIDILSKLKDEYGEAYLRKLELFKHEGDYDLEVLFCKGYDENDGLNNCYGTRIYKSNLEVPKI